MENAAFHDQIAEGLGEDLALAGESKVPMVTCNIESVLSEEDIAEYCSSSGVLTTAQKSNEKDVNAVRARHHAVARLLAMNLSEGVVAQLAGYTPAYISTLKQTPSMLELIAHYRSPGNQAVVEQVEKLRLLSDMSLEQLLAKVENKELSNQELLQAIKLGADRSGAGPTQKIDHQHTHQLDEEQLRRLNDNARKTNASRIIDIAAVRKQLPAPREDDGDAVS